MLYQVSIEELAQNLVYYIDEALVAGIEIVIVRDDKPIAKIAPLSQKKTLSSSQMEVRNRVLQLMKKGLDLGGKPVDRDTLHE